MAHTQRDTGSTTTAAKLPWSRALAVWMAARIHARRAPWSSRCASGNAARLSAKWCSTVCTTISPSLSERTAWPSAVSQALRSSQLVTLPLWAPYIVVLQRTRWGWALASVTAPNVAQRTWPQNTRPPWSTMPNV